MAGSEESANMREEDTRSPIKIEPMGSPGSDASQGQNGHGVTSGEDSLDNSYDAPLDFSTKKRDSEHDDDSTAGSIHAQSPIGRSNARLIENTPSPGVRRRVSGPDLHGDESNNSSIHSDTLSQSGDSLTGRIGEPQLAALGLSGIIPTIAGGLPANVVPNPALLASLPNLPISTSADPRRSNGGNGKNLRPFKAYPKDPLSLPLGYYAIPGMLPIPSMDPATLQAMGVTSTDDLVSQYRQYLTKIQDVTKASIRPGKGTPPHMSNSQHNDATRTTASVQPASPPTPTLPELNMSVGSPGSSTSSVTSTSPAVAVAGNSPTLTMSSMARKRGRIMPDEQKDNAYWDRRRKNNEAAKRSRDARRAKEDEIAIRAALLEQENLKLRVEVAALKNETAKLRCMLYNS